MRHNYTFRLSPELRERLDRLAQRDGLELAEWVRVALTEAAARSEVAGPSDKPRAGNDQPQPATSGTLYRQRLGAELLEAVSKLGWKAPA